MPPVRSSVIAMCAAVAGGASMSSCRQPASCTDPGYDAGELIRVVVQGEAEYGINCPILPLAPGTELSFVAVQESTTEQDGCVTRAAEPAPPLPLGTQPPVCQTNVGRTLGVFCNWQTSAGCQVSTYFQVATKMPRDKVVYEDGVMGIFWGGDSSCVPAVCSRADHYRVRIERLGFVDAGTATD
jgi:hypothetical protein